MRILADGKRASLLRQRTAGGCFSGCNLSWLQRWVQPHHTHEVAASAKCVLPRARGCVILVSRLLRRCSFNVMRYASAAIPVARFNSTDDRTSQLHQHPGSIAFTIEFVNTPVFDSSTSSYVVDVSALKRRFLMYCLLASSIPSNTQTA